MLLKLYELFSFIILHYQVHPDYIVPEYTIAVALQDTTAAMGATGICPGKIYFYIHFYVMCM